MQAVEDARRVQVEVKERVMRWMFRAMQYAAREMAAGAIDRAGLGDVGDSEERGALAVAGDEQRL